MSYLIYARKYRPMTFEEMIGQKAVVRTLQNAVKNDRVSQAYIFSGMRGTGKTTAARILAKALNCKDGPTPTPCNKCEFCVAVNEDRSVDVLEIDGASNRGIDEVRSLREGIKYKPIHSRFKVIIIDEVHMLTRDAFNALLKTLEEPPAHTVFIFATTEFYKVPATIVSRCQHFEFKKISQKELINHLIDITKRENITISPLGLNLIANAADGSLRDVLSLLDQAVAFSGENIRDEDVKEILGSISQDILLQVSLTILDEKPEMVFPLVESIIAHGYDLRFFHKELILHFRNLLLIRTMEKPEEFLTMNSEELQNLRELAEKVKPEDLLRYLTVLQESEQELKFSSHPRIFLEMLLVRLCHFKKLVPLKSLLDDIEELKREFNKNPTRPDGLASARSEFENGGNEPLRSARSFKKNVNAEKSGSSGSNAGAVKTSKEAVKEKSARKDKEVDVAMKDPTVQNFMDTFKAQILSIEHIKKKKT